MKTKDLLIIGGIGVGLYVAWEFNIGGIQDLVYGAAEETEETFNPSDSSPTYASNEWTYPYNYYPIQSAGSHPQTTHTGEYPFPYPYPPTSYQQTAAPTTLPAAHYQLAGTPNIRQYPGTTTIMSPPNAYMPNPTLWWDKGGLSTNRSVINRGLIDYGPYRFEAPIFQSTRYGIQGTNIDYPFIAGPIGPSPCPIGEYRASDGRCYRLQAPPPESCNPGWYRASDGRCYPMR